MEIKLFNKIGNKLASTILSKLVSESMGVKVKVNVNDIKVNVNDENGTMHLDVDADIPSDELVKFIKGVLLG